MNPTSYADVNALLETILSGLCEILGSKIVGLYAFGSLVTGDFDRDVSDIDLTAALATDLDDEEFQRLERMHAEIVRGNVRWDDRIEVGYISVANLRAFHPRCTIAVISPGEPFHRREAENGWRFNLHVLREQGLTLFGPSPATLVPPVSSDDLAHALRERMREWREWTDRAEPVLPRQDQAYAILTMCRALVAHETGEFVSKRQAAAWAAGELPQWSSLIRDALAWRAAKNDGHDEDAATRTRALQFTRFMADLIIAA